MSFLVNINRDESVQGCQEYEKINHVLESHFKKSIGKEYNEQKKERMTFKSKFWQRFILFKSFQD